MGQEFSKHHHYLCNGPQMKYINWEERAEQEKTDKTLIGLTLYEQIAQRGYFGGLDQEGKQERYTVRWEPGPEPLLGEFPIPYDDDPPETKKTYFPTEYFRIRENPRIHKEDRVYHNRLFDRDEADLDIEYHVRMNSESKRNLIEVSLATGLGWRFRINMEYKDSRQYFCKHLSKMVYGHTRMAGHIRDEMVKYVVANWKTYLPEIIKTLAPELGFYRMYKFHDHNPKRHKWARDIYRMAHRYRWFSLRMFEVVIICEKYRVNLIWLVNVRGGMIEVVRCFSNYDRFVHVLASEVPDPYYKLSSCAYVWTLMLLICPAEMSREQLFLHNMTLYMTYENKYINYYHVLEYPEYLEQIGQQVIDDCLRSPVAQKFKLPTPMKLPEPEPHVKDHPGHRVPEKLGRTSGHIYYSQGRKYINYWRPRRRGLKFNYRNAWIVVKRRVRRQVEKLIVRRFTPKTPVFDPDKPMSVWSLQHQIFVRNKKRAKHEEEMEDPDYLGTFKETIGGGTGVREEESFDDTDPRIPRLERKDPNPRRRRRPRFHDYLDLTF